MFFTILIFLIVLVNTYYLFKFNMEKAREFDRIKEDIRQIRRSIETTSRVFEMFRKTVGEDLKNIGGCSYAIYSNVELMSSMSMANHIASTNEAIKRMVESDNFEAAKMLKDNLDKLVNDFKKMNPNLKFDIRSASDLIDGMLDKNND